MAVKLEASKTLQISTPKSLGANWKTLLIGHPLPTASAKHQTIGKAVGLAVFAADALSSTGYATQEILTVLALAGAGAFRYAFPVSIAIGILIVIVTISYEQTIHAYPGGGGAYIVARDNLGELPAQTAGAALLTDYIMTVAVSISSGVAQIISAFPLLYPYRVYLAIALVFLIMLINLRGVRESGITFAIPIYFFLVIMLVTTIVGIARAMTGTLGPVVNPPQVIVEPNLLVVTPFLLLHAFANGTSAMTGIEAISNGITAFKDPKSRNAGITLIWMSAILGSMFLGITYLAGHISAIPSETETVISQIARTVFGGRSWIYMAVIAGTSLILILAANTAYADFPRLGALHAGDGFLPKQLTFRGSRLVYSRGIVALAVIASSLIFIFQASVTRLIPLYAIGVFLSFTLSQSGMAYRWWKSGHLKPGDEIVEPGSTLKHDRHWVGKMIVNTLGAVCTAVVVIVFAVTKFAEGAWIVIILTPAMVAVFYAIHRHYKNLARQLSLENGYKQPARIKRNRVIMPIGGVHQGTLAALRFARKLSDDITAVHVAVDPQEAEKVSKKWEKWGDGCRLVVLDSPYRETTQPLLDYLARLEQTSEPGDSITIVVPQFVSGRRWSTLLHSRTADALRRILINNKSFVIVEVPYQVQ